jgi:hypothetical protein
MYRLIQIIRNSFIRLEGLLYQVFGFFGKFLGWLNQRFNFLSQLLGFTESQYFTENEAQATKPNKALPDMSAEAPQSSPPAANATRRRPDTNMDYYLKLARQEKKKS